MARVDIRPELVRWARERARLPAEALAKRFPRLAEWKSGAALTSAKTRVKEFLSKHTPPRA